MNVIPKTREDLKAAVPDTSRPHRLKGVDSTVRILRDRYGIPHVKARSVHDAFFGQGFATAQDRLWHMEHDRRWAYGRWAEYSGENALEEDIEMRRLQVLASVRVDYASLNEETKAIMNAYAAGVNAFIETTDMFPVEYSLVGGEPEPWRPWDCLAVFKARHITMGVFLAKLWRARLVNVLGPRKAADLMPGYEPGQLLIVLPGARYDSHVANVVDEIVTGAEAVATLSDIDIGSNNWALAGDRTASGRPLVAGDPHRSLDTPNVYYQNHVACPEFDAIGLSFPGCPGFPHFGHNSRVAWCVTHVQADYQDLYIERFKPGTPPLYEYKGEWREAEHHREIVNVRGGAPVEMNVYATHHGPIVRGCPESGVGIALKYTAITGPNKGFQCLLRMLRAASADEMDEAMRDWVDPCNNFLFADVHGNIGYLTRGRLPVRSKANALLPVPGWTGEHEWRGFVPFEEMPRARNPEVGYIVTANNRVVGEDYPHYIAIDFSPDYRARRITERLGRLKNATVRHMISVHAERVSIPGQTYARLLSEVSPLDGLSEKARVKLAAWDGSMEQDAVEPTLYSAFRLCLERITLRHLLGPLANEAFAAKGRGAPPHLRRLGAVLVSRAEKNDASLLQPGTNWRALMAQALAEGVAYLQGRLGDDMDRWTWARVHFTRPRHTLSASFPALASLLDPPSVPMGGDGDTPQAAVYDLSEPFTVTGASVARYVFDLGDWDNSAWVVPLGASGHPGSPHYTDQESVWADVRLIPMEYGWDRIEAGAESVQDLKPEYGMGIHPIPCTLKNHGG